MDGQMNECMPNAGSDDYNEKSVRYVGKSIPSKCFRLLQDMTGGPRENDALPGEHFINFHKKE